MRLVSWIFLLCGIVYLSSCFSENYIDVGQIENIKISGIKENSLQCQAELEIENRYCFPIKLNTGDLKVYISEKEIGSIELNNPLRLKAREKKVFILDFNFILKNDLSGILSIIQKFTNGNTNVTLKGNVVAHSFLMRRKIPVNMKLNNL